MSGPMRSNSFSISWRIVVNAVLAASEQRQFLAGLHVSVGFLYFVAGLLLSYIGGPVYFLTCASTSLVCILLAAISVRWHSVMALFLGWTSIVVFVACGLVFFFMAMAAGAGGAGIG